VAIDKIDVKLCNGCGMCIQICPTDVFRMDKKSRKAIITYPEDCQVCELCMVNCPTKAIMVTPQKSSPLIVSWG
jgi:NAD-dependent dihydropyrimidine dehydrogenase PreA subunit